MSIERSLDDKSVWPSDERDMARRAEEDRRQRVAERLARAGTAAYVARGMTREEAERRMNSQPAASTPRFRSVTGLTLDPRDGH
jgi:hypothetical protein